MKRWIDALGIAALLWAGSIFAAGPARGADLEEILKKGLGKTPTASSALSLALRPETRDRVLDKFRKRLPEPLQEVEKDLRGVSRDQEIAIGRQIAGNLLGAAPLVNDRDLQRYVNLVGRWVAEQSERADLPWHFGVIESPSVNAFAAPGGYIFLTRGLYALLRDEGELAGVLAHEIGHVLRRHHLKILQKSRLLNLGKELLSSRIADNPKIQTLIGRGAEITARSLDRNAEFDADQIAVVLAARAGYDAFSLPSVLQQIGHFAAGDDRVTLLFKTHPHPDTRLENLDKKMGSRLDRATGPSLARRFHRLKPPETDR